MAKSDGQLALFPELPEAVTRRVRRPRFFFALWPDSSLRKKLADVAATVPPGASATAYRVKPFRYHLTLTFLGELDPRRADAALRAGDKVKAAAFELQLDALGHFAGPNVVWIGPSTMRPELAQLKAELDRELLSFGLPIESAAFRPHVSCLRNVHDLPDVSLPALDWPVQEFVLVRSVLGGSADAGYKVLRRWPLGTGYAASTRIDAFDFSCDTTMGQLHADDIT